jgi:transposase-like protein
MNMPSSNRVEVVTSVERRRRWTAYEKREIVEETHQPERVFPLQMVAGFE